MTQRFYSSTAPEKQLVGSITSGQTNCVVSDTIGLPTSFPYTLALSYETIGEELVQVSSAAGTTLTIVRAIDGTSATSHAAGARVRHTSSARDFADSRNHENADDGVHGLAIGEEIVGTDKVQTLTNKTVVNLQGTFLHPDITQIPPNHMTITNTPAFGGSVTAVDMINGSESVLEIKGNGNINIRNPLTSDTATATRRLAVTMSDGTTERFHIDTGGQATALPRAGTIDANGGFKVVDAGDSNARKAIQIRDSTDTVDRFVAFSGGYVDITSVDPAQTVLDVKGAAAQSVPYARVLDSTSTVQVQVTQTGQVEARRTATVLNDALPASPVMVVSGNVTQTADLQRWNTSVGATIAHVRADGSSDFTPAVATSGIFSAGAGWSTSSQVAVTKAGVVTVYLALNRTGPNIVADPGGDLITDVALGTILAAYRPHTAFAGRTLAFAATNFSGTGSYVLNGTSGDLTLVTWSTGGTLANGSVLYATMTYPLDFS